MGGGGTEKKKEIKKRRQSIEFSKLYVPGTVQYDVLYQVPGTRYVFVHTVRTRYLPFLDGTCTGTTNSY